MQQLGWPRAGRSHRGAGARRRGGCRILNPGPAGSPSATPNAQIRRNPPPTTHTHTHSLQLPRLNSSGRGGKATRGPGKLGTAPSGQKHCGSLPVGPNPARRCLTSPADEGPPSRSPRPGRRLELPRAPQDPPGARRRPPEVQLWCRGRTRGSPRRFGGDPGRGRTGGSPPLSPGSGQPSRRAATERLDAIPTPVYPGPWGRSGAFRLHESSGFGAGWAPAIPNLFRAARPLFSLPGVQDLGRSVHIGRQRAPIRS